MVWFAKLAMGWKVKKKRDDAFGVSPPPRERGAESSGLVGFFDVLRGLESSSGALEVDKHGLGRALEGTGARTELIGVWEVVTEVEGERGEGGVRRTRERHWNKQKNLRKAIYSSGASSIFPHSFSAYFVVSTYRKCRAQSTRTAAVRRR